MTLSSEFSGPFRSPGRTTIDSDVRTAIEKDDFNAARALILKSKSDSRASVGLPPESELSAMQVAAYYEPEAADLMFHRGVACDLHSACALGCADVITKLGTPTSFDACAEHLTPMGFAVTRGQEESIKALLDAGDDVDRSLPRIGFFLWELEVLEQQLHSWTPLHAVSAHGYMKNAAEIIRLLVERGADLNRLCCMGEAPIHLAATFRWVRSITALLELGAGVDTRTEPAPEGVRKLSDPADAPVVHGQTPLMIAAREGQVESAHLLLAGGADLHARDSSGATPLHVAARPWWEENTEFVQVLLDAGADPTATDDASRSPIDLAEAASYNATVQLLRS